MCYGLSTTIVVERYNSTWNYFFLCYIYLYVFSSLKKRGMAWKWRKYESEGHQEYILWDLPTRQKWGSSIHPKAWSPRYVLVYIQSMQVEFNCFFLSLLGHLVIFHLSGSSLPSPLSVHVKVLCYDAMPNIVSREFLPQLLYQLWEDKVS